MNRGLGRINRIYRMENAQFAESAELETQIKANLEGLVYPTINIATYNNEVL